MSNNNREEVPSSLAQPSGVTDLTIQSLPMTPLYVSETDMSSTKSLPMTPLRDIDDSFIKFLPLTSSCDVADSPAKSTLQDELNNIAMPSDAFLKMAMIQLTSNVTSTQEAVPTWSAFGESASGHKLGFTGSSSVVKVPLNK